MRDQFQKVEHRSAVLSRDFGGMKYRTALGFLKNV